MQLRLLSLWPAHSRGTCHCNRCGVHRKVAFWYLLLNVMHYWTYYLNKIIYYDVSRSSVRLENEDYLFWNASEFNFTKIPLILNVFWWKLCILRSKTVDSVMTLKDFILNLFYVIFNVSENLAEAVWGAQAPKSSKWRNF